MTLKGHSPRDWGPIIRRAKEIAESYEGITPTLRQLFYRLVAATVIPNSKTAYNMLAKRTAAARREGWFPELDEYGRRVWLPSAWDDPADALRSLAAQYRTDRTDGQEHTVVLAVEKNALVGLLRQWFGPLGVAVVAVSGQASETICRKTIEHAQSYDRPAVLIGASDFDPSGEAIWRNFAFHTREAFDHQVRVALTEAQVTGMLGLQNYEPAKPDDPNTMRFISDHPDLHAGRPVVRSKRFGTVPSAVQVEMDALDPNDLRALYQAEIDRWWDAEAWNLALTREEEGRDRLAELADGEQAA